MGRGNDYREPRRRGYDDEQFSPPASSGGFRPRPSFDSASSPRPARGPEPSGPVVDAVVKWFKSDKGFGFVELSSGGDAFLHASVLQPAGFDEVPPGATLKVMTGQGQKGLQVTRVVEVDVSTASTSRPSAPRAPMGDRQGAADRGAPPRPGRRDVDLSNAQEVRGVVKWYNGDKGFGFVSDGSAKDIFIHVSVLQNAGLQQLDENQPITIMVIQTPKGREAAQIVV